MKWKTDSIKIHADISKVYENKLTFYQLLWFYINCSFYRSIKLLLLSLLKINKKYPYLH